MEPINSVVSESLNVLIHVIILFTFLSALFFIYISKVEGAAFRNELGDIIENGIDKLAANNPELIGNFQGLEPIIDKLIPIYNKPSQYVMQHNITVKFTAVFVILILFAVILTIVLVESLDCKRNVGISRLVVENVIIFAFIGIVEFVFFTKVAIKYVPTPPSLLSKTIVDAIKRNLLTSSQK